jgi:GrpB-like predicted nucleotidyltransferase (UPF0157 family)
MRSERDVSVEVVPYSEAWPILFEQERAALQAAVGDVAASIEHIGSTAVPGLSAKPTIDILLVVDSIEDFLKRLPQVEALGYDYRAHNTFVGSDTHLFLRKVSNGKRTHHLHVLRSDSPEIEDYRRFRDALRNSPALVKEYERLKLLLVAEYATDRRRYVTEKANWLGEVLASLHELRDEPRRIDALGMPGSRGGGRVGPRPDRGVFDPLRGIALRAYGGAPVRVPAEGQPPRR